MKIVITGGHLSPALAVMTALPKDWEVLVIGRTHAFEGDRAVSLEYQAIKKMQVPFVSISTGRLQRVLTAHTVTSLLRFPYGILQSFSLLRRFQPDIVLSFGGYVSLPVTIGAFLLSIPVVVHEQTREGGLANRITALFAKQVCISWESSKYFFPKEKTVLTGNPLRSEFTKRQPTVKSEPPLIYVTGGSTGSHTINVLIEGCIAMLLKKYRVLHQTGDAHKHKDFARLFRLRKKLPRTLQERYRLVKFVEPSKVPSVLSAADLVVARSGINTVTELLFMQKPSLLIPLPHGQGSEQEKNARFFKKMGLGEVLQQASLTPELLQRNIDSTVRNKFRYRVRGKDSWLKKNAAEEIVRVMETVANS